MAHTKQPVCAAVQSHLLRNKGSDPYQVLPQWSEHVAGCPSCRSTLMLVARNIVGHRQAATLDVSCAACQHDLAAYVDAKQEYGTLSAAERYSHVWWHVWTCAECAETYEWMFALVAAEASGELEAFPFLRMPAQVGKTAFKFVTVLSCSLPRSVLTFAFGPSLLLGDIRGDDHEAMLIDDDVQGYHLRVALSQIQGATCTLSVATQPSVVGWAVISVGTQRFKAALDDRGEGQISSFPLDVLQDATGPDLLITVQTEAHELSA